MRGSLKRGKGEGRKAMDEMDCMDFMDVMDAP
jgi:hypothetical protein